MAPEVFPDQVAAARQNLRSQAIPAPEQSKTKIATVNSEQNTHTWGVEPGPEAFKQKFSTFLSEAETQLTLLHTKLASYEQALGEAVAAFEKTDDDVAATNEIMQEQAETNVKVEKQESQLQNPTQPTPVPGSGPVATPGTTASYDDPTAPAPTPPDQPVATPGSGPVATADPTSQEPN